MNTNNRAPEGEGGTPSPGMPGPPGAPPPRRVRPTRNRTRPRCTYCSRWGHYAYQCRDMLQASAAQGRELQATLGLEHLNVEQRLQILGPLFHPPVPPPPPSQRRRHHRARSAEREQGPRQRRRLLEPRIAPSSVQPVSQNVPRAHSPLPPPRSPSPPITSPPLTTPPSPPIREAARLTTATKGGNQEGPAK